jgi:1,2-diacylglycerol 3-alpha-glucosyltransferase
LLLNTFDTVIAPTEKVKEKLESYNVAVNIEIIPTGIDLKKFQQLLPVDERNKLLKRYGLSSKDKILIYVGRIAEEKNIEEVISFYNKALEYVENTKLLIVGGGPCLPKLKTKVSEYKLESNVIFTDMINSDEINKYYKLGDYFITASTSETQGITYIEALASGLPVICKWDKCVDNLIIDGLTGFTYENEKDFVNILVNITSNKELEESMKANIKNIVNEYSIENFGQRVIDIYNNVLTNNKVYYSA